MSARLLSRAPNNGDCSSKVERQVVNLETRDRYPLVTPITSRNTPGAAICFTGFLSAIGYDLFPAVGPVLARPSCPYGVFRDAFHESIENHAARLDVEGAALVSYDKDSLVCPTATVWCLKHPVPRQRRIKKMPAARQVSRDHGCAIAGHHLRMVKKNSTFPAAPTIHLVVNIQRRTDVWRKGQPDQALAGA